MKSVRHTNGRTDPGAATTAARRRVAIIGSGISGLAHAEVLTRCGFECVLFERGPRIGGVWAPTYRGVSLPNRAVDYHLSSFPWPFEHDAHPTGEQILRYLDALAAARRFDVRLAHEVVRVEERDGGWDVRVRATDATGNVAEREERFEHVVVSVGQYTEGKLRPQLEGEAEFAGRVVTERAVDDLSIFDGKRVVVVGFGKSALDMATFAAPRASKVHHVFRTPRWTLPRRILGLHYSKLLFNRFGSVMMTSWAHPTAVERFLHRRTRLVASFWATLQALFAWIARRPARGDADAMARIAKVLPEHDFVKDLRSAAALAPDEYHERVASGAVEPHRGEVARLTHDGVVLTDGTVLGADLVVLSVGSRSPRFPFLPEHVRALLEQEDDGVQLYRHIVHPRLPTLAFAGFNHGFMHVPAAEIGALWLVALWQGRLTLPSVDEMERAVVHVRDWKREHIHFEPSRSCAVNTRYQQYLDIMLGDLGITPYRKLPNVVAEVFGIYGPRDYAGVIDEFLRQPSDRNLVRLSLPP